MFGYFKAKYDPFPNPIKCVVPEPNPTFSTVLSQHSKLKFKDKVIIHWSKQTSTSGKFHHKLMNYK